MEVNISDLTWDQFIYPRGGKNEQTINAYVEQKLKETRLDRIERSLEELLRGILELG